MDSKNKNSRSYLPVIFALLLAIGVFIGSRLDYNRGEIPGFFSLPDKNFNKVNELINFIEQEYVDEISKEELVEKTINSLLEELDPHSYYISAKELAGLNEPLEGNFEGIGIEFSLQKDTVAVISTIAGGPSEAAGILPGDRIVSVDDKNIAGVKLTNEEIIAELKGKKGTLVNIGILRRGNNLPLNYTITRGTIPIYSIETSYMVDNVIGYIKISRFSKNTYVEFIESLHQLRNRGMKKLIIDLRGNGGGYLDAAIKLADEFLGNKQLIVYTEGKARPRTSYYATKEGNFENLELAVLIDENSASASEILAGALQDNDKGFIFGRRSFGKGLVQEQVIWPDSSAIRLTIARYYTPTGRSIQKTYVNGNEDYFKETYNRYEKGELMEKDSIHFADSLKFYTSKGRVVYGGGGIMPDFFIPIDTIDASTYLSDLFQLGLVNQFAFEYVDQNRDKLKKYKNFAAFNKSFFVGDPLFNEFVEFAVKNGVKADFSGIKKSGRLIKVRLKAYIARQIWKNEGFYPIAHTIDNTFLRAVETISKQ